ncbi:conserved Plasmodium protein, unknown function [Plasmodium ovale wallikeri]|uniref:Uncharacterized protein n=1 Tax=Plasmodium ovale wallikeri TaxID=864142 RepID=A0A1A8YQQ8_PLAOA|nr:conserved Plasmodium protein, unknown function [Plasmodium ovale wallikeri]SBT33761.1 conserved Plasmodium protein, unknown function [Plasmodium ovale wallikeri]
MKINDKNECPPKRGTHFRKRKKRNSESKRKRARSMKRNLENHKKKDGFEKHEDVNSGYTHDELCTTSDDKIVTTHDVENPHEDLKNDGKTSMQEDSFLNSEMHSCDMHQLFYHFFRYINCAEQMKENENGKTDDSELTVNYNPYCTTDNYFLCKKGICSCRQCGDENSTANSDAHSDAHSEVHSGIHADVYSGVGSQPNCAQNSSENSNASPGATAPCENMRSNLCCWREENRSEEKSSAGDKLEHGNLQVNINYNNSRDNYEEAFMHITGDENGNTEMMDAGLATNCSNSEKEMYLPEECRKSKSSRMGYDEMGSNNGMDSSSGSNGMGSSSGSNGMGNSSGSDGRNDKITTYSDSRNNSDVTGPPDFTKDNEKKQSYYLKVNKDIIYMQINKFKEKIDEYISDEKIFRAQKLIEHLKKYIEYYINYFTKINKMDVVNKLINYYEKYCTNKNNNYNINNLKVNMIFYFLSFFRLNEMYNALCDYSYYFSIDRLNCATSHSLSNALDHNSGNIGSSGNSGNNGSSGNSGNGILFDNSNTNRKCSVQSCDISDLGRSCGDTNGGGPCNNSSLKCFSITESENTSKINFPTTTKGGDSSGCVHNGGGGEGSIFPQTEKDASVVASVGTINGIIQGEGKIGENRSNNNGSGDNGSGDNNSGDNGSGDNNSGDNNSGDNGSGDNNSGDNNNGDNGSGDNNSGDNNDCRSATPTRESQGGQPSPPQSYSPSSHNEDNGGDAHLDYHNISSLNNSKGEDEGDSKDDNSVIVDKLYHQHYNTSNLLSSSKVSLSKKNNDLQNTINTKGSNRHMVKIIQKYSKRLKNFRKIKQDKEGWVKENDKYLDLWHRVDSENNISVHIRGKLPYEVKKILSILSETELSANWAPFLTSAKRIKHLSKSSAVIAQMYEYPIIGKKESLLYCLGEKKKKKICIPHVYFSV